MLTQNHNAGETDLGALALHLAFRSIAYVPLAIMAAAAVFLVGKLTGFNLPSNPQFWMAAAPMWVALECDIVRRIRREAGSAAVIRNDTWVLHGFETTVGGFLLCYSLAQPYLSDSDASAFPFVKIMFEVFIGILAFCHVLVLAIFKQRPNRRDIGSLAFSLATAIFSMLGVKS